MTRPGPIGIFDSGVGGLTVVRAIARRLPGENIVYLGDTARVPYGSKSPRTVERYSLACQQFLLDRHVDVVLIACNTASANALAALKNASPVPVVGAVIPGADSAARATQNGHVGVLGTLATVRSQAYDRAIRNVRPDATVTAQACPLLVPLAEEGWTTGSVPEQITIHYLRQLFDRDPNIDTLVLGCTHYPLLVGVVSKVAEQLLGRPIAIIDSATAMASRAIQIIDRNPVGTGRLELYATDVTRLGEIAPRFLGQAIDHFELVDL